MIVRLAVFVGVLLNFSSGASASQFEREANSGRATLMRAYSNYSLFDCTGHAGTVSIVAKPAHGTLRTSPAPFKIDISRFTGTKSKCAGKTVPGVNVYYTSAPGFHGTDTFTLRAVYREGLLSVQDLFRVQVK